ncbi:MAG: hypothetical protein ACR2H1_02945 [Limisphaerales bacterium]
MKLPLNQSITNNSKAVSDKKLEMRLKFAAVCDAILFVLVIIHYDSTSNLLWEEWKSAALTFFGVTLPTVALISLLPVLVRGLSQQRLLALILALPSGYMAYQGWEGFIFEFFIYGY